LNVGFMVFFIPRFGLTGAAVAYLLSMAPVAGFIWYTEKKILRLRKSPWLPLLAKLLIPAAAQCVVALVAFPFVTSLITLILVLGAVTIVLPLTYYLCGFVDVEDRELLVNIVSRRRGETVGGR